MSTGLSQLDNEIQSHDLYNDKVVKNVRVCNADEIGGDDANLEFDTADGILSAIKAVYKTINGVSLANNNVDLAQATVIGITRTAANDGEVVKYRINGKLEDSSLNFPINDQIYLDTSGNITNVAPANGFRTLIGTSLGAGAIQIQIQEPIIL